MDIKIDAEGKCIFLNIIYDIECKPHAHSNWKPSINCLLMDQGLESNRKRQILPVIHHNESLNLNDTPKANQIFCLPITADACKKA